MRTANAMEYGNCDRWRFHALLPTIQNSRPPVFRALYLTISSCDILPGPGRAGCLASVVTRTKQRGSTFGGQVE